MIQVARLAGRQLGPSADSVAAFLRSQLHERGGFVDRDGKPDLYYTVFGIDGYVALQQDVPVDAITPYLESFGDGASLDFLHHTCLARCWSALHGSRGVPGQVKAALLERINRHRTSDGGYHIEPGAAAGSAYGCFVTASCLQDLGEPLPDRQAIARCLANLAIDDGSYANDPGIKAGNVPGTAAAVTLQHQLELPIDAKSGDYLLSCAHPEGGLYVMPGAPMPDLLSSAVGLHALSCMKRSIEPIREACLDYIDTLWTSRGGFYGHWAEEEGALDVEYTWYGLLALGHLSV